jgi:hypothetical protein
MKLLIVTQEIDTNQYLLKQHMYLYTFNIEIH